MDLEMNLKRLASVEYYRDFVNTLIGRNLMVNGVRSGLPEQDEAERDFLEDLISEREGYDIEIQQCKELASEALRKLQKRQ